MVCSTYFDQYSLLMLGFIRDVLILGTSVSIAFRLTHTIVNRDRPTQESFSPLASTGLEWSSIILTPPRSFVPD